MPEKTQTLDWMGLRNILRPQSFWLGTYTRWGTASFNQTRIKDVLILSYLTFQIRNDRYQ